MLVGYGDGSGVVDRLALGFVPDLIKVAGFLGVRMGSLTVACEC